MNLSRLIWYWDFINVNLIRIPSKEELKEHNVSERLHDRLNI